MADPVGGSTPTPAELTFTGSVFVPDPDDRWTTVIAHDHDAHTLAEHSWVATERLREADELLAQRGLVRRSPWREDPELPGQVWRAMLARKTPPTPTPDTAAPTAVDPKLAALIQQWGLAKCVYAAAHDVEPNEIDDTDGAYGDVCALIFEDWCATLEPLARAVGLSDDAEYAEILERVQQVAADRSVAGTPTPTEAEVLAAEAAWFGYDVDSGEIESEDPVRRARVRADLRRVLAAARLAGTAALTEDPLRAAVLDVVNREHLLGKLDLVAEIRRVLGGDGGE